MSMLSWAVTAFKHTRVTLVIGMSNQPYRKAQTGGWSSHMVNALRTEEGSWIKSGTGKWVYQASTTKHVHDGSTTIERIRQTATRAATFRAGNCGEHASVAFIYLVDNARCDPRFLISRMTLTDGDHGFLVLNRDISKDGTKPAEWGDGAIILDVWGRFVCTHAQLMSAAGVAELVDIDTDNVALVQNYIKHHNAKVLCERMSPA
ncbi:MAG: hypothetical protein U0359_14810 [Byssovorax sp.]